MCKKTKCKALKAFNCVVFILTLFAGQDIFAQTKISLTGGVGIYELANVGIQWNYSKRSSLSAYGGWNFGVSETTSWSTGLSFDQVFLKPAKWKIKPGYSVGILLWTSDDELYYFKTLSLPMMALLAYPVSPSLTIRVEGGVVLSDVAESDRKQNVEAGFPQRVNGNFRVNIIYKLGKK